jgi:hypothetical protein
MFLTVYADRDIIAVCTFNVTTSFLPTEDTIKAIGCMIHPTKAFCHLIPHCPFSTDSHFRMSLALA